ncbi:MAG: tyrosine--tRNA ligase [Candidatus Dormibacteraeota bacterium]|nr:tyrosine--tRNA ligase [Candidatus Dormibacteraeota bacterium]
MTNEELWALLRERAVEMQVEEHLKERLLRGDRLRVKLGCDPTAPDLHVGHLVVLDILRAFQDAGHTVVYIVGDYTALIGDPSGRSDTRPALSREQVDENARTYFRQVYRVLDPSQTEVHGNAEWLSELGAEGTLRLLSKQTLQAVLQREDFHKRLEEGAPISAHEILYPFNQAYDSVAIRADVEIGGTDQLFNLLFGRDIQRAYGQQPQDVMVFPLLEGLDGVRKMSKSLGNYIGLTEPPAEVYGKVMSIPDPLTEKYLRLVSGLSEGEQAEVLARSPRDAKAALARALVTRLHGATAAREAEADFDHKFRRRDLEEADLPVVEVATGATIAELLVAAGAVRSLSHARRLADQGGLSVGGEKVTHDRPVADGEIVKAGKRTFVRAAVR